MRGFNRDRTRDYRPGTSNEEMSNNASDIDFFFFSETLESEVTRIEKANDKMWRTGNNVHPEKLEALLEDQGYAAFQKRLAAKDIQAATLLALLRAFPTNTKNIIGRKSDVTLLRSAELTNFADDEYVLV